MCKPGYCAGADGICHAAQNELVAKDVMIKSVGLPEMSMKVEKVQAGWLGENNDVGLEKGTGGAHLWNIWRLPQRKGETHNDFIFESSAYPGQVLYSVMTGTTAGSIWEEAQHHVTGIVDTEGVAKVRVSKSYDFHGGVDAHSFTMNSQAEGSSTVWMRSRDYYSQDQILEARAPSLATNGLDVGLSGVKVVEKGLVILNKIIMKSSSSDGYGSTYSWLLEPPLPVPLPFMNINATL